MIDDVVVVEVHHVPIQDVVRLVHVHHVRRHRREVHKVDRDHEVIIDDVQITIIQHNRIIMAKAVVEIMHVAVEVVVIIHVVDEHNRMNSHVDLRPLEMELNTRPLFENYRIINNHVYSLLLRPSR